MQVDIHINGAVAIKLTDVYDHIELSMSFGEVATVEDVMTRLAGLYAPQFAKYVYDPVKKCFMNDYTIFIDGAIVAEHAVDQAFLKQGDKVFLYNMYKGG